jgi:hypothetical protein
MFSDREYSEIHFGSGNPDISSFRRVYWREGERRRVEFFPGHLVEVVLTSVRDPNLTTILTEIAAHVPIVFDIEWWCRNREAVPSLYQLCSSPDKVYLIRDLVRHPNFALRRFFNSHSFVGKGVNNDCRKLQQRYDENFKILIEDVEETRLGPYGDSLNFEQMVHQFVGQPCTTFKQKKISLSNWETRTLSIEQVLYAAFDVHALFMAFEHFPPGKCYLLPFSESISKWNVILKTMMIECLCGWKLKSERCPVCHTVVENCDEHIWRFHADIICQMFKLGSDIPEAVHSLNVTAGGKLKQERRNGKPTKYGSFREYRRARQCVTTIGHFPVMITFFEYLMKTGRLFHQSDTCALCGNSYGESPIIHVWDEHSGFLVEWFSIDPGNPEDFQLHCELHTETEFISGFSSVWDKKRTMNNTKFIETRKILPGQ